MKAHFSNIFRVFVAFFVAQIVSLSSANAQEPSETPPLNELIILKWPAVDELYSAEVGWSPDNTRFAVTSHAYGEVVVFSIDSVDPIAILESSASHIHGLDWSPDGRFLAHGDSSGTIYVWDAEQYGLVQEIEGEWVYVHDVAWSHDSRYLAASHAGAGLRIWNTDSWEPLPNFTEETFGDSAPGEIAWSPAENMLAVEFPYPDSQIRIINIPSGEVTTKIPIDAQSGTLEWSTNASILVSGGYCECGGGGAVHLESAVWHVETIRRITSLGVLSSEAIDWHPSDPILIAAYNGGFYSEVTSQFETISGFMIWDMNTFTTQAIVETTYSGINDLAWSPNGQYLAVVLVDGTVRIWGLPE